MTINESQKPHDHIVRFDGTVRLGEKLREKDVTVSRVDIPRAVEDGGPIAATLIKPSTGLETVRQMVILRHGLYSRRDGVLMYRLCHGLSKSIMDDETAIISIDASGHGDTKILNNEPGKIYPIEREADDIQAVVRHYSREHGIQDYSVIGHSRGAAAAVIAASADERIKTVIMANGLPDLTTPKEIYQDAFTDDLRLAFDRGDWIEYTHLRNRETFQVSRSSFFREGRTKMSSGSVEKDYIVFGCARKLRPDQEVHVIHSRNDERVSINRIDHFKQRCDDAGVTNVRFYAGGPGQETVISGDHMLSSMDDRNALLDKCAKILKPNKS